MPNLVSPYLPHFREDLSPAWPQFFPPGVACPDGAAVLELSRVAGAEPVSPDDVAAWLRHTLAGPLVCATHWSVFELSVETGPRFEARRRRGYRASRRGTSDTGTCLSEVAVVRDDILWLGGVARLDPTPATVAASMVADDASWRVILLAPQDLAPESLLAMLPASAHADRVDFFHRYAIPELVAVVVPVGGVVVRFWGQCDVSLDLLGPRAVLADWFERLCEGTQ